MSIQSRNFGLTGQSEMDYDYFFLSKKARKEKQKIRFERRTLKNDQRRADTERTRIENQLMQSGTLPPIAAPASSPAEAAQMTTGTGVPSGSTENAPTSNSDMGTTIMLISAAGVLLVVVLLVVSKKKKISPVVQTPVQVTPGKPSLL
jgi:hypothetical protein